MVTGVNYIGNHGSDLFVRSTGTNAFVKAGTLEPSGNYNGVTPSASLTRRMTKRFTGTLSYTSAELSGVSPDLR